jgi:ubiquinone/menaquinone biosynthesis C-methylase UbiE
MFPFGTFSKRNKITEQQQEHSSTYANGHKYDASYSSGVAVRDAAIVDTPEEAAVADGGAGQSPASPRASRTPVISTPRYFMDSLHEAERLERKTDPYIVGRHLLTSGLRLGMRALDVACGSGSITRMMARIVGSHLVTGVDASEDRLAYARLQAGYDRLDVDFKRGSAEELPFPDGHFDYTHARFLFQYLEQPEKVLREMVRVTRPGGRVVVADLDNQLDALYPVGADLRDQLHQALLILAKQGFDPLVGRKLYKMFRDADLRDVRIWVEPHQLYYGGLPQRDRDNWEQKLATATKFLARSTGDFQQWEDFRRSYLEQIFAPDTFYYSTLVLTQGRVPT